MSEFLPAVKGIIRRRPESGPLSRIGRRAAPALVLACLGLLACGGPTESPSPAPVAEGAAGPVVGEPGGRLVTSATALPRGFNPLLPNDLPTRTILARLHADLVHIDRYTQGTVPALAESWEESSDGRVFTVRLRQGVRFSDGEPFDADDVIFTYSAVLDPEVGSPNRELLIVDEEPLQLTKIDDHTVEFRLGGPYAVGERLFDSIPILPEHRLGAAWREGRLAEAWGIATPVEEIVGLGPYRLASLQAGERIVLRRNPHYWRRDADGGPLPYLDEVVFVIVGSEEAEAVRLQSGDLDISGRRLGPRNFEVLESKADTWGLQVADLGASLQYEFLFFNLNRLDRSRPVAAKQRWFRDRAFRLAVSQAIDRQALVSLVFAGRATALGSHVTPGNRLWRNTEIEPPPHSPQAARDSLAAAGYRWDENDALLDADGTKVEFTLITNSSNTGRVQMGSVVQEDLARIGIAVTLVPLEFAAVLERVLHSFDYEACLLGLGGGDVDPNSDIAVWHSDGPRHLWRLSPDAQLPAWQREIDALLERQLAETDPAERKRLYDRVQELAADHQPLIPLVSRNVLVAAKRRLGNFRPAVLDHPTLWNVDELFWRPATSEAGR